MNKSGLVELEAVLAVARRKGFRTAAVELGMSASALSQTVANLETRLGIRLFHRTTRSVSLTDAGEEFVTRIAPALAEISEAKRCARSMQRNPSGTLRINASLGATRMIFEPIIVEYLRRQPRMTVDIVTDNRMIDIVSDGFDAGIRPSEDVPQDMVRVPIGNELEMAVVGTPEYFNKHPIPQNPWELERHNCIRTRHSNGTIQRWEFSKHGEVCCPEIRGNLISDAPLVMHAASSNSLGLAYLAEWYVSKDIEAGRLIRVLEDWMPAIPRLALFYPAGKLVPSPLRALIDLIKEYQLNPLL